VAKIKIVRGKIQISCCCDEHKQFLARRVEYEIYKLYHKEDEEQKAALPILKKAV